MARGETIQEAKKFFGESMRDIAKGPEYCAALPDAACTACEGLGLEIENWNQLKNAGKRGHEGCAQPAEGCTRFHVAWHSMLETGRF